MKRREFTKGLAAAGLAPTLPLRSLTSVSTGTATGAANFTPFMYSWGVTHARGLGQCSVEILIKKLGIGSETAAAINSKMIKQGIISAPNALGISKALASGQSATTFKSVKSASNSSSHTPGATSGPNTQKVEGIKDHLLHTQDTEETIIVEENHSNNSDEITPESELEKGAPKNAL